MPNRNRSRRLRNSQAVPYRERWNPASPNSNSRECCDGSLWAQGIGRITG